MCDKRAKMRPYWSTLGVTRFEGLPEQIRDSVRCGGVAEWLKAAVLKTAVRGTVPWVRIPPPPPTFASARFSSRLGWQAASASVIEAGACQSRDEWSQTAETSERTVTPRNLVDGVARRARDSSSRQSHASGADARLARAVVLLRRTPGTPGVRIRARRRGQARRVRPFLRARSFPHRHARRARARCAHAEARSPDRSRMRHGRGRRCMGARVRACLNPRRVRSPPMGG